MNIRDSITGLKKKILGNKIVYLVFPILFISVISFVVNILFVGEDAVIESSDIIVSTNIPKADEGLLENKDEEFVYDENSGYDTYDEKDVLGAALVNEISDSTFIAESDLDGIELNKKDRSKIVMKNQEHLNDLILRMNENKKRRKANQLEKKRQRELERKRKEAKYARDDKREMMMEERQKKHDLEMARLMAQAAQGQQGVQLTEQVQPQTQVVLNQEAELYLEEDPKEELSNSGGFNSVNKNRSEKLHSVEVYGEYKGLVTGSTIKLRLLEDINKDGIGLKRNNIVYGRLRVTKKRIDIEIDNVVGKRIKSVEFQLYDYDGTKGLNVPTNLQNEMLKKLQSQASRGKFIELPLVGRIGTNILTNNRVIKVDIPNSYKLYLK